MVPQRVPAICVQAVKISPMTKGKLSFRLEQAVPTGAHWLMHAVHHRRRRLPFCWMSFQHIPAHPIGWLFSAAVPSPLQRAFTAHAVQLYGPAKRRANVKFCTVVGSFRSNASQGHITSWKGGPSHRLSPLVPAPLLPKLLQDRSLYQSSNAVADHVSKYWQ